MIPQWTREELDPARLVISDEDLVERAARVKPLILKNGDLCYFDIPNLHTAFTWEPAGVVPLDTMLEADWYVEVSRGSLHFTCAYYGFFKPTLAEVYAQLPDDPEITAFYLRTDSMAILHDGEGHICDVVWLTNKPRSEKWRRARMQDRIDARKAKAND